MSAVRTPGYERVKATPEEVEDYKSKHRGRGPAVERSVHLACGTRLWHSGLAVGSHRKACRAAEPYYQVERYDAHWGGWREVPTAFDDDRPFRTYDIGWATNRAKDLCRHSAPGAQYRVRDLNGQVEPRGYVNRTGMVVSA